VTAMVTERVEFFSEGERVAALWRTAGPAAGPRAAIVQGPGWLGLMDGRNYERYHRALCAAGFGVLILDYRGSGASAGDPRRLSMSAQLRDLTNAVSYLCSRDDVDPHAIGCFGSGGTGAGHPFLLARDDARIRAIAAQLPISDGADWLRRMRTPEQWDGFLAALELDRRRRARSGTGRLVDPRSEIVLMTDERRATTVKADVDGRSPREVLLSAADELLVYRPIDAAPHVEVPAYVIAVEGDTVTPTDHARQLVAALRGDRRLTVLEGTTHYESYAQYGDEIAQRITDWFSTHLRHGGPPVAFDDEPQPIRRGPAR